VNVLFFLQAAAPSSVQQFNMPLYINGGAVISEAHTVLW